MSEDKTRLGLTPTDGNGAQPRPSPDPKTPARPAEGSGSIRPPNEATIVLGPNGNGDASAPIRTKTLSGVPVSKPLANNASDATMVLGHAGPKTLGAGTPTPGTTPVVAPPTANTQQPQTKPARNEESGLLPRTGKSAWDTFDGASTAVHATSAAPHPGVRINQ